MKHILRTLTFLGALVGGGHALFADSTPAAPPVNTFSIVAFDPASGELGVAVASKVLGVGSIVPWAKANVGAIATQANANTRFGPDGLALLQAGKTAKEVLRTLTEADSNRAERQLAIVDVNGNVAAFTGEKCQSWAGHLEGKNFTVQGNILARDNVLKAMAKAYEDAQKELGSELADWLVAALQAAQEAGGDSRGKQSAALLIVRDKGGYGGLNDRYIDLRVEDNAEPIQELHRLLGIHKSFFESAHKNRGK